jgi:hypothetical protein
MRRCVQKPSIAVLWIILTASALSATAWSREASVYLSWRAPYGHPGASDTLTAPCGDGTEKDTLYLTFETGEYSDGFFGVEGILFIRAPAGELLSPHWFFDKRNLEVQYYVSDSIPGATQPWQGLLSMTTSFYDRTSGSGRLRLSNIRPIKLPVTVRDSVQYFFARIPIPRPLAGVERCNQPICIEWFAAEVCVDSTGTKQKYAGRGGNRFVSWNSPGGAICGEFRPEAVTPAPAPKTRKTRGR